MAAFLGVFNKPQRQSMFPWWTAWEDWVGNQEEKCAPAVGVSGRVTQAAQGHASKNWWGAEADGPEISRGTGVSSTSQLVGQWRGPTQIIPLKSNQAMFKLQQHQSPSRELTNVHWGTALLTSSQCQKVGWDAAGPRPTLRERLAYLASSATFQLPWEVLKVAQATVQGGTK